MCAVHGEVGHDKKLAPSDCFHIRCIVGLASFRLVNLL